MLVKYGRYLVIISILAIGYFAWREIGHESPVQTILNQASSSPTASPFPFSEMTIPSLRSRSYESKLNELEKYSEKANFTTYLTSYDSDGLKINGLLTIPKTDGPHPAIVFVHGYIAPTVYKTTEKYGDYVDYLARNGFVVFKIDLRGHDQSEGNPGGAYYSQDYVVDTLNAYSALQQADFVDPNRVGVWGHSMAGNVTFRSVVAKQNIPALVIWAGAGYTYRDLLEYRISDNSYRPPQGNTAMASRRQQLRDMYGEFDEGKDFWRQVVPTNYLEGVTTAIQVNHAEDDEVVSIEYSRNLMKYLDKTSIIHELNEYSSGGHNITGQSFNQAMKATVEFYRVHLSVTP